MKKKLLIASIMMLTSVFAYSQIEQGTMYLGGSFNLSTSTYKIKAGGETTDGPKTFSFGLTPIGGYFVSENFMVGMGLGYTSVKTTLIENGSGQFPTTTKTVETNGMFNIVPMARYYMFPSKRIGFFVQGSFTAGFGKDKLKVTQTMMVPDTTITTTDDAKTSGIVVAIRPGLVFLVGDKFAFEAAFGGLYFQTLSIKSGDGDAEVKQTTSNFGLDINPSAFSFGVAYHF